jgi:hypothetical protein
MSRVGKKSLLAAYSFSHMCVLWRSFLALENSKHKLPQSVAHKHPTPKCEGRRDRGRPDKRLTAHSSSRPPRPAPGARDCAIGIRRPFGPCFCFHLSTLRRLRQAPAIDWQETQDQTTKSSRCLPFRLDARRGAAGHRTQLCSFRRGLQTALQTPCLIDLCVCSFDQPSLRLCR